MSSMLMEKQKLRERYLVRRNELSSAEREEKSREIMERLYALPAFMQAKEILVYVDYRSEVQTKPLISRLLASGSKRVFVPKVEGMDIRFYEITSMEQLESGYQGILEPKDGTVSFEEGEHEKEDCLMLLPGSVFDRSCNRMGYGKGFYDRYMARVPWLFGIGLSFECQIAPGLPCEAHDYRPELLVTEKEIYRRMEQESNT